jgi:hypothetical protein
MKKAACRTDLGPLTKKLLEQQQAIERLTAERDLARRQVCRSRASCIQDKTPEEIANALGWDCFKVKHGVHAVVEDFR